MKRTSALQLLAAGLLVGCKQPPAQDAAPSIRGSRDIEVHVAKLYPADTGSTQMSLSNYVVCQLTFTNDLGFDVGPRPKNFVLNDQAGQKYYGVDSGVTALVGISNYTGVVKKDQKQDYTIAFQVPLNTTGTVYYEQY